MVLEIGNTKNEVFASIADYLTAEGFSVVAHDYDRPWGGFFVIDECQTTKFVERYFSHLSMRDFEGFSKLSPKILVVQPHKRLSWQYHLRRAEIWKLIAGNAGVVISDTDEENQVEELKIGQLVNLKCGERHRLVGMPEGYGVVAEIWQHTDVLMPSDESDIVRVQDDFGR